MNDLALLETSRLWRKLAEASKIIMDILDASDDSDVFHDVELQSFLVSELTTIIGRIDAFDYDPDDLEFVYHVLFHKAIAFAARFRMAGELDDIDEAISLLKTVTHFPDCDPSDVAFLMFNSAELRYGCTKSVDDLDRLIESEEALLRFEDFRTQDRLCQLAMYLSIRYKHKRDIVDAERSLSLCEEVFPFLSADSDDLPTWLRIRSLSIYYLSQMGRRFSDIRETFEQLNKAISIPVEPTAVKPLHCFIAYQLKFAALAGDLPQLREIGRIVHSHPECMYWNLSLIAIFKESTEAELDESITSLRAGCNAANPDECMPMYTAVLAVALFERFWRVGKPQDIQEAIAFRAPFSKSETNSIDIYISYLGSLIVNPEYKEVFRRAAASTYLGLTCSSELSNEDLMQQYINAANERYGFTLDLVDQMNLQEQLTLCDHPMVELQLHKSDHLESIKKFRQFLPILRNSNKTSSFLDQLYSILDFFYSLANNQQSVLFLRQKAVEVWFIQLIKLDLYDKQKYHVSEMCDIWLSIMKERNLFSSSTRGTLLLQHEFKSKTNDQFLTNMVIAFLKASRYLDTEPVLVISKVLQILESGRSLLWGQIQSLHVTIVGILPTIHHHLFTQLEEVTMTLKGYLGIVEFLPHSKYLGYYIYSIYEERQQLIEQIQLIPGYEHVFQDNVKLEIDSLEHIIENGPIVTLLASDIACVAIIITQLGSSIKNLPITLESLKQLHIALCYYTKSRNAVQCKDISPSTNDDSLPVASTSYLRIGWKKHRHSVQSVEKILECLWNNVAKPVLDIIWDITGFSTKGKERADRKPSLDERERIWWCCIGEFSFMPIHAAGIYERDVCTSISDYFISSYTPTLGALLRAYKCSPPTGCKILTVAQPDPWAGKNRLPSVEDELQKILDIVPHNYLISLGDSERPDLKGKDATVENVVSKLPEANIFHIACHGVQDKEDSLNSGFILADGKRLTVEEIMKLDLPNAHTAILSACHTASNDPAIPDESINLASALLYAGFSSILGTKWPMADSDGPLIAEEVYTALFRSQGKQLLCFSTFMRWIRQNSEEWNHWQLKAESIDSDSLAEHTEMIRQKFYDSVCNTLGENSARSLGLLGLPEIIDGIARKLRTQGVPAYRWATFIHIGV